MQVQKLSVNEGNDEGHCGRPRQGAVCFRDVLLPGDDISDKEVIIGKKQISLEIPKSLR